MLIDKKVIDKCLKGNSRAQKDLYKAYAQKMFVHCYRYLQSKEDAEEMVSDGFIRVFQNLKTFVYKDLKSLEAWIKRIMINECLMSLRKRKLTFLDESNALNVESESKSDSEFEAEEIYNLILSLPDGYRTIFNLFVIEGYSHKEISKSLNITESTSRSQLTKARMALKSQVIKTNLYGRI